MERSNSIRPSSNVSWKQRGDWDELFSLAGDEIHLWCANIDIAIDIIDHQKHILSEEERTQATRFHFQKDRQFYRFSHILLRILLGSYLHIPPQLVQFQYGRYGKPFVGGPSNPSDIRFNMSHSGSLVLFGIAPGYEIGVDVAYLRRNKSHLSLAEHFFAPTEVKMLRALPAEDQVISFFNCWTRKEAFIKATGNGLSQGLHTFAVSLAPGDEPLLLWLKDTPTAVSRWTFIQLDLGKDYVGAVAFEEQSDSLKIVFRTIGM